MLRNFSITARYAVAVGIAVAVQALILTLLSLSFMDGSLTDSEEKELKAVYENVMASISQKGQMAQAMSALVAEIPSVQTAFANGQRETLEQLFVPGFAALKSQYGARQFQFHTPPATSFLRVHKPEKHGDDLSTFRETVVETNRAKQPITGLEMGVAGLGIRGMVPVSHQGEHIGSVEFGMSFGQQFFDEFTQEHGIKLGLYMLKDNGLTVFGSTIGTQPLLEKEHIIEAVNGEPYFAERTVDGVPVAVYVHQITDYSGKPIAALELVKDRSFFVAQMSDLQSSMAFAGFASFAIIALLVWWISRSVVQPLRATVQALDEISSGTAALGARLPVKGRDEVAFLSRGFNTFVDKIERVVEKMSLSLAELSGMADQLSTGATHTKHGMQRQNSETSVVATAMNEMSSTVQEVARNTEETAESAKNAGEQARTGKDVVNNTIAAIELVATDVASVDTVVKKVNDDTTKIGTVLDVIRGIAEQTNLLALNATIEAARAGEQGRGFAVVADEVRTLAHRTQQSTQEIQGTIQKLQQSADEAVSTTEKSLARTTESVEQARLAGEALDAIVGSVDTITRMSTQVASASSQQRAVVEEIGRNVTNIGALAEETAHGAQDTAEISDRIVAIMEELVAGMNALGATASTAASVLERAKASHKAWTAKLRAYLDGVRAMDESELVSDHECAMGRWYFSTGSQQFGQQHEFRAIEAPHRELHEAVKRIVGLKDRGDMDAAEMEYQRLAGLSEKIVHLIENLERHVV
ncbi:MAG: CZB domain-containing protein [Gammaproteobacteria bacterium]|nr:CZB domain-containing protein [Gammaproteobacteria bacterium]